MGYVIIEPLDIRISRTMAKLLKHDDQKVFQFDKEAKRAFEASSSWLKNAEANDENAGDTNLKSH